MFRRNFLTPSFLVFLCALTNISSQALADCTPANDLVGVKSRVDWVEGGLVYDTTNDVLKTCDGTNWTTIGGASLSGGTSGHLGVWSGAAAMGLSGTTAGQQLFWDLTNHRLGIGTTTPIGPLTIVATGTTGGEDDDFSLRSYNSVSASGAPGVDLLRGRGSLASPTTVLAGDALGNFWFGGHNGTAINNYTANLGAVAEGNFNTSLATAFTFTTHNGTANAERMRITGAGNVGIGTATPSEKLTVFGNISLIGNTFINNAAPTVFLLDSDHRSAMIHSNSNTLYFLRGSGNGSTSWVTYNGYWPLQLNLENNDATFGGNVYAFGYFHNSDARLKDHIEAIQGGLEIVSKLRGVSYQWKHDHSPALGVIAQDVEKVIPSAVKTNDKGDKTVEYDQLIGPLIEAVKELKSDNDNLRDRIEQLENAGAAR